MPRIRGVFEELPESVKDFKTFDPDYPHAQFESFDKSMLRGHASGLNVAHHALANDLEGVNFSSIRAGVLEDRESWKALQSMLTGRLCRPVFDPALRFALAAGHLVVGQTVLDVERFDRYRQAAWLGRRWAWVDPKKDLEAAKLLYDMGGTSLSAIMRDLGLDPETIWRERKREQESMAEYGVTVADAMQVIETEVEAQADD